MTNPNSDPSKISATHNAISGSSKPKKKLQFKIWIDQKIDRFVDYLDKPLNRVITFLGGVIIALLTICLTVDANKLASESNQFEKDQRAIEITLHLATYWETNLDAETRRKAKLITENGKRDTLLKDFAKEVNTLDVKKIRNDNVALTLLELNSNAKDSAIINAVLSYHNALTKVLNTMEALASIKLHTESNIANEILDEGFKCNFMKRYDELKSFIEAVRVYDPKVWQPIDEVKVKHWKDYNKDCRQKEYSYPTR